MNGPAPRRLTRSSDRYLGGVCGGVADYFSLEPTLVRVVAVLLLLVGPLGGLTFLGYVALWIALPESTETVTGPTEPRKRPDIGFISGIGLLVLGAWLLVGRFGWMGMGRMHGGWVPGFAGGPLVLVLIGVIVVMVSRRKRP